MPQVLTRLRDYNRAPEVLMERPALAAMIATIAARSQRIINEVGRLFASLLGQEEEAALAIYLELIDRRTREAAFWAVARKKLTTDQCKVADKLFKKIRKASGERDRFIHGTWITSSEHPDGLLLVEAKEYFTEEFRTGGFSFSTPEEALENHKTLWERCTVTKYTAADFRGTLDRLAKTEGMVHAAWLTFFRRLTLEEPEEGEAHGS